MMFARSRNWTPIALCCIPAVVIAVVGLGIVTGGAGFGALFGGPLGLGLIVLALLLCPLSMGWMMWRMQKQHGTSGNSAIMAECCLPEQQAAGAEVGLASRLQKLRTQREVLAREVTELQGRMEPGGVAGTNKPLSD